MQQTHSVNVKIVIFSVRNNALIFFAPSFTLPFSELSATNTLEKEANNLLSAYGLGRTNSFMEQLYTHKEATTISIVYYMLLDDDKIPAGSELDWILSDAVPSHIHELETIEYAIKRLQWKIEYTNIVYSLLSDEFTLSELQGVYEAILGKTLDKRNFRKKILSLNMLRATGEKKLSGRARPAELYTFLHKQLSFVEIL